MARYTLQISQLTTSGRILQVFWNMAQDPAKKRESLEGLIRRWKPMKLEDDLYKIPADVDLDELERVLAKCLRSGDSALMFMGHKGGRMRVRAYNRDF